MRKYNILLDGITGGIEAIASAIDCDAVPDLLPIIGDFGRVLAAAAAFHDDNKLFECNDLAYAISGAIVGLLDCIESDSVEGALSVVVNLSRALAIVARTQIQPQPLLMSAGPN